MHDLTRLYAREQAIGDVPAPARATAVHRALHHYLATARTASLLLNSTSNVLARLEPDRKGLRLDTAQEAIDWVEQERDNLVAAALQAATRTDDLDTAVGLAAAVHTPFAHRGWLPVLAEIHDHALSAAVKGEDWVGQAQENNYLGSVRKMQGRIEDAIEQYQQGLACWDRAGQPLRKAGILHNLATAYARLQRFDDALATQDQAIALAQESGQRTYEATMLNGQAGTLIRMGRPEDAIELARKSLDIWSEFDSPHNEGAANDTLANACRLTGRLVEAEGNYRVAVELQRRAGHRGVGAASLWGLGDTLHDLGRHEEARECWRRSAEALREVHLLTDEEVRQILAQDVPSPPAPVRNH